MQEENEKNFQKNKNFENTENFNQNDQEDIDKDVKERENRCLTIP